MIIVEHILGNRNKDAQWQAKLADANIDLLMLDQWEAQKSRCRKHSQKGLDIGISLDRHVLLSDGDVILFDEATQTAVVVQIALRDVMVIDLHSLKGNSADQQIRVSFELGHALGNQHWKAVIKDNQVYVPLTVSEKVMSSVMRTHGFSDQTYQFVKGETILAKLTNSESRLLFGGAEDADVHVHVEHQHDKGPAHSHDNKDHHQHDHHHDHQHDHNHHH
ncbi:hypothetical protein RHO15_06700 [Utexia brackfieldae]|uniref:urease accessory protein UreE n=1 Tax=Utexia brackfieldae TaxID=3074108 RepID=UPI00370DB4B6